MAAKKRMKEGATTRERLLGSAIELMRHQGFCATTVDQICARASVTKGAFFHHFHSKEEIGEAAVDEWCRSRAALYAADLGDPADDPLLRLRRWIDGLIASAREPNEPLVCLLGMISQEMGGCHEAMRGLCQERLAGWTGLVAQLLAAAQEAHRPRTPFDPEEVGWMLNSLWQGSLLVAKTRRDPEIVVNNLRHAQAYLVSLFEQAPTG